MARVTNNLWFSPCLPSWRLRTAIRGRVTPLFVLLFGLFSFCDFFGAHHIFLGQAWAEGRGELATRRHLADSGREPVKVYATSYL